MTGERVLDGLTVTITGDVEAGPLAELRAQGAVVRADPGADAVVSDRAVVGGHPDRSSTAVGIGATAGTSSPRGATVFAADLDTANAVMAVLAAGTTRPWPADVALAARPEPVVAVPPGHGGSDDALAAAIAVLDRAGARVTDDVDAIADVRVLPHRPHDADPDGCWVTVPSGSGCVTVVAGAFGDAVALDVAALIAGAEPPQAPWPLTVAEHTELVVFGAHLRGGALAHQLTDLGARWAGAIATSQRYRMTRLPTVPPKPAVTRVPDGVPGASIAAQRWLLSPAALGRFLVALPAPMQLGKVEFDDGSWRTSFGCDGVAADAGVDITGHGGWAAAIAAGAV